MTMAGTEKFTRSRALKFLAGLIVLILLLLTVLTYPATGGTWQRTFSEYLHVPAFGIIAVCLLVMTPPHWARRKRILVVASLAVALSFLSEVAQIPTPRDASLHDVIADLLGAAGFLAIAAVFSSSISVAKGRGRYLILLGIALVAWPLRPLATISAAYLERNSTLPTLVSFDSKFGNAFFRLQNTDIKKTVHPATNSVSAEIRLKDGPWPGIIFHDLWPNWEPYSVLVIEIENPESESLPINIRVHDRAHRDGDEPYGDRFNRSVDLASGMQTIRVTLADIQSAPTERQMNMTEIDGLVVFSTRQESGRTFVLHEIRLE